MARVQQEIPRLNLQGRRRRGRHPGPVSTARPTNVVQESSSSSSSSSTVTITPLLPHLSCSLITDITWQLHWVQTSATACSGPLRSRSLCRPFLSGRPESVRAAANRLDDSQVKGIGGGGRGGSDNRLRAPSNRPSLAAPSSSRRRPRRRRRLLPPSAHRDVSPAAHAAVEAEAAAADGAPALGRRRLGLLRLVGRRSGGRGRGGCGGRRGLRTLVRGHHEIRSSVKDPFPAGMSGRGAGIMTTLTLCDFAPDRVPPGSALAAKGISSTSPMRAWPTWSSWCSSSSGC